LAGALAIFTTQGYAAASMDRIAKAAGVSKPTLYSYFQDKEGLFLALVRHLTQQCDPLFPYRPAHYSADLPPEILLRQLADKALTGFAENPALLTLIRLIIGESERFPTLAQSFVREIQKPMLENLAAYFQTQPQLNFSDPMVAARIFAGSLMHFLIVQKLMQGEEILPLNGDRLADGLVAVMMAAGQARGTG
jgi:AcrR family transcriptional regulator